MCTGGQNELANLICHENYEKKHMNNCEVNLRQLRLDRWYHIVIEGTDQNEIDNQVGHEAPLVARDF